MIFMQTAKIMNKRLLTVLILIGLIIFIWVVLNGLRERQDIRKKAVGSGEVSLAFKTMGMSISKGDNFKPTIRLYNDSVRVIKVSGAQAILNVSDKFIINSVRCLGSFNDVPFINISNQKVTVMCSIGVGATPIELTDTGTEWVEFDLTVPSIATTGIAEITFQATSEKVTEDLPDAPDVSAAGQNASYQIVDAVISDTPTPTATGVPGATITPTLTPTPSTTPSPTPSPTGVVSETPTPTLTPTGTLVPTITLTPTPPSGQEAYTIDIGTKAVLSINIGSGNTPQIKFTAKLAGAEGHPDMYFRLRAKDDLAFVDNPNSGPTCESPGAGGVDLYVPMKADNSGIYTPVTGINISAPAGAVVAPVSADGWVSLTGLSGGKYYTLNLKGPKTRGTEMLEHVLLAGGQSASQNYDWTDNGLQPGDLPDPNNSNKQDCTVNSVDISLINSRLGKTDPDSLNIADVSYDGVVNANDIAQVVGTLSTKPDDDN